MQGDEVLTRQPTAHPDEKGPEVVTPAKFASDGPDPGLGTNLAMGREHAGQSLSVPKLLIGPKGEEPGDGRVGMSGRHEQFP
jgi:hypothetical protein